MSAAARAIGSTDVLVVDCQATGATPAHGALLEIAWTRVRPDGPPEPLHAHRVALPGGARIPPVVSRLTGLADGDGAPAIPPSEAWRLLRDAAREVAPGGSSSAPTVIHFARFESAFLGDLHARFDRGAPFPLDVVCVHEIARRLFPDLPRRGLRALAGYLGHGAPLERRAAGHVEATAHVWRSLAVELAARDVRTFDALARWVEGAAPKSRRRAFPLPREQRLALPDAPGVYRMLRSNGDVLYVGKATSLKKRVSSHFAAGKATERALEMLTQVREVAATETATPLEAALLEADEIKRLAPPYNVQLQADDRSAWFASADLSEARPFADDTHRFGPLPSRGALAPLGALRALVLGATPNDELRARATGVRAPWGPPPEAFAAGWRAFLERHLEGVRSRTPRGALDKASRRLVGVPIDERDDDEPWEWTPDRVRRRLERALLQGGVLLRRARWLCLLAEAAVAFRETSNSCPRSSAFGRRAATSRRRLLVFAGGELTVACDLGDGEPMLAPATFARWRDRQRAFDAARYDRLRVLATELKRVDAEGGHVAVHLDARRLLEGDRLRRLLRFV